MILSLVLPLRKRMENGPPLSDKQYANSIGKENRSERSFQRLPFYDAQSALFYVKNQALDYVKGKTRNLT